MPHARDIHGVVFNQGAATLLARIVDADGDTIESTDIAAAEYSVLEVDECDPAGGAAVQGHDQRSLSPEQVLYDTLQTPAIWTTDAEGFNFRHDLDVATNDAFPQSGRLYHVRYTLTPAVGQKIVFRFALRAI